ncbi:low-density lipoprotein receptor-related protein 11 [Protobothrops mucrosquamatus]|uniref:low-density lipoprotein receptor-related protein 11 n=1 Tax=Protobothrops mucrosquamatus TaxID=103944 RepID=UPI0007757ADD|nr:low-density lipoprotein receptor-related protein 11 [Protobothrops mucrosquamatus]
MAAEVPGPPGLLVLWLLPPLLLLLGAPARSTGELRSPAASGVESLLEEFRRQLQLERDPSGGRSNELEEAAGHCRGGTEGAAGGGGSFFSVRSDSIIRTKDSIAAGATFLGSPSSVAGPRHCLDACCADARCTLAVLQQQQQQSASVRCYLFSCTYRGRAVCVFSPQRGYNSYFLEPTSHPPPALDTDEPPLSKAGEDIILQLPVDWVILDGRESVDDHGITRFEWTLLQGASSVDMQVPQPGTLKLSHMPEGKYTLQLTVTDTAGQRSSDNISVTVLPMIHSELGCVGKCSRYQFLCDDGCCIDITYACDGEIHCPDGSDEAFCQKYNSGQNAITHIETIQQNSAELMKKANEHLTFEITQTSTLSGQVFEPEKIKQSPSQGPKKQTTRFIPEQCLLPLATGSCNRHLPRWHFDAFSGTCMHFIYGGCKGNENNFLQESDCLAECVKVHDSRISGKDTDKNDNDIVGLKSTQIEKSLPVPETGAVLPLALGLAITALLLLMVACRLRLVRQKLKKARPTTSEESDYLINGMYL